MRTKAGSASEDPNERDARNRRLQGTLAEQDATEVIEAFEAEQGELLISQAERARLIGVVGEHPVLQGIAIDSVPTDVLGALEIDMARPPKSVEVPTAAETRIVLELKHTGNGRLVVDVTDLFLAPAAGPTASGRLSVIFTVALDHAPKMTGLLASPLASAHQLGGTLTFDPPTKAIRERLVALHEAWKQRVDGEGSKERRPQIKLNW